MGGRDNDPRLLRPLVEEDEKEVDDALPMTVGWFLFILVPPTPTPPPPTDDADDKSNNSKGVNPTAPTEGTSTTSSSGNTGRLSDEGWAPCE